MSLGNIMPMIGDNDKVTTPSDVGVKFRKGVTKEDETFKEVMHRWGQGTLHAGPGEKTLAESQEQALAIAFNIAEDSKKLDGGAGSGFFGHAGREGEKGGSSAEGGNRGKLLHPGLASLMTKGQLAMAGVKKVPETQRGALTHPGLAAIMSERQRALLG